MAMALVGLALSRSDFTLSRPKFDHQNPGFRFSCLSSQSQPTIISTDKNSKPEYKPTILDNLFLKSFRNKMVQEANWDSDKLGYDGLIDVANRLMIGRSNSETTQAAVRILRSLFPPLLLELYKMLISPLAGGKVAAVMVARVTALTCQWLMGPCSVNTVDLPNGSSLMSGTFMKDYMGVPLLMEPNFSDYSCQFKFGVLPPVPEDDKTLKEPCLEICPNASRRKQITDSTEALKCPKA